MAKADFQNGKPEQASSVLGLVSVNHMALGCRNSRFQPRIRNPDLAVESGCSERRRLPEQAQQATGELKVAVNGEVQDGNHIKLRPILPRQKTPHCWAPR